MKKLLGLLTLAATLLLGRQPVHAVTEIPSGDSFIQEVPQAANEPLGAAQYFHIFANQATLKAHTNGNIATGDLIGDAGFGTNRHEGSVLVDRTYLRHITRIQASSFATGRGNHVVFGKDVPLWLTDQNHQPAVFVNQRDLRLDHLKPTDVFQDTATATYLNITQTLAKADTQGEQWAAIPQTAGTVLTQADLNRRTLTIPSASGYGLTITKIDQQTSHPLAGAEFKVLLAGKLITTVTTDAQGQANVFDLPQTGTYTVVESKAPEGYHLDATPHQVTVTQANQVSDNATYVHLDADFLQQPYPLWIKGLSRNGGPLIITVDAHHQPLTLRSQIIPEIDGSSRNNHETEDFSDAKILWNFTNASTINVNAPWQGTILAPQADIFANQNVDGSLIADQVTVNAETHRWDFQSTTTNGTPAQLTVTNAQDSIELTGQKQWIDNDNAQGLRPDHISIVLTRDDTVIARQNVSAETGWQYHFIDLPATAENGHRYVYAVSESPVAHYTSEHVGANFINTIQPDTPTTPDQPTLPDQPITPNPPTGSAVAPTAVKPQTPKLTDTVAKINASTKSGKSARMPHTGNDVNRALIWIGISILLCGGAISLIVIGGQRQHDKEA